MTNQRKINPDKAEVIIFPPLLYLLALVIGTSTKYVYPTPFLPLRIALILGVILLLMALIILWLSIIAMRHHKTTINPGGSTTTVVKTGIYRFTRNPMYISFTLIYTAVLILVNSWIGLLILFPLLVIVQKGIIEKEEKYLATKFGEEYLNYKKKVKRWF